jgi:IPTL-CTERM motif
MFSARWVLVLAIVGYCSQAAWAQGQVRSYFVTEGGTVDPSLPVEGFVVTDISVAATPRRLNLKEGAVPKVDLTVGLDGHHFTSGIPFAGGSELFLDLNGYSEVVTISGYIPSPSVGVPTVSQWGLLLMVMVLLIGGTTIFARRRVATA